MLWVRTPQILSVQTSLSDSLWRRDKKNPEPEGPQKAKKCYVSKPTRGRECAIFFFVLLKCLYLSNSYNSVDGGAKNKQTNKQKKQPETSTFLKSSDILTKILDQNYGNAGTQRKMSHTVSGFAVRTKYIERQRLGFAQCSQHTG